ncbi:MAG: hypothetical protein WC444_06620 [Candidatus Paceibacterota bacterium]
MVNAIKKGKSFEREVANYLTAKTGVTWHRVPQSGAFATVNNSNDSRFDGDVFTEDEQFKDLVVECKSNKNDVDLNVLFNPKSMFWSWVEQTEFESKDKRWLLFFKITHKGFFLVSKGTEIFELLDLHTSRLSIKNVWNGAETLQIIKIS